MIHNVDTLMRSYEGELDGHPFKVWVTGVLSCFRVPDVVRDNMRYMAADVFLADRRILHLTRQEVRYWIAVRSRADK